MRPAPKRESSNLGCIKERIFKFDLWEKKVWPPLVSISSTFTCAYFVQNFWVQKNSKLCYELENFGAKKICTKNVRLNVDEIDSWSIRLKEFHLLLKSYFCLPQLSRLWQQLHLPSRGWNVFRTWRRKAKFSSTKKGFESSTKKCFTSSIPHKNSNRSSQNNGRKCKGNWKVLLSGLPRTEKN